jgi:Glycosyltransferase
MPFLKKKILVIVPTLSPGGSERFVSILFNCLNRDVFDVKLVVLNSENVFYKVNHLDEVYFLNKKDVRSSVGSLIKIISHEKPDVIFSVMTSLNILLSFIKIFYSRFKLILRETTILSIHFKPVRNSFLYEIPVRLFYRFSDRIVCQSQFMKNDLVKTYGISERQISVINNPIAVSQFPIKREASHPKLRLITVARLDRAKGYDRILKALARLTIDFEYFAVGDFSDPTLRPVIDHLLESLNLKDKVNLVGVQSQPQNFLVEADLYLHGSTYDGFPNVVLEAGAVGLPVVAFNTTGIGEIVLQGQSGLIVPDDDITAYANAIEEAASTAFDKHTIRQLIAERFDAPFIMNKYENLLKSVAS